MSFSIQSQTAVNQLKKVAPPSLPPSVPILSASDVPSDPITNAPFTFQDLAQQVVLYRTAIESNPVMQQYISNPLDANPAFVLLSNRVLVNISRNFCNDPANPPPAGYIKRATVMASDGEILCDVITYMPSIPQFNYDRNVFYWNSWYNLINTPQPPVYPIDAINSNIPSSIPFMNSDLIFNSNFINPSTIATSSKGMELSEQHVIVQSDRTYTFPADTINPPPTGGNAVTYAVYPNIGGRTEMVQAVTQGWGWASRKSSVYQQKPGYYVANFIRGIDGYAITIRIAYIKI